MNSTKSPERGMQTGGGARGRFRVKVVGSTELETMKNVVAYGKLLEEEGLPPVPFTIPPIF